MRVLNTLKSQFAIIESHVIKANGWIISKLVAVFLACVSLFLLAPPVLAQESQESTADLAKKLANPLSSIWTVPLQLNYDGDINGGGYKYTLNIQPVIPIALDNGAKIITRTIVPVLFQSDIAPGVGSQLGLGDILFSAYYVPPHMGKLTWGVGPTILVPTSTDKLLGTRRWAAGLSGLGVYQTGPWTFGGLASHLKDFAGSGTADINNTLLQPFAAYTTSDLWTFSIQSESTYNWETEEWGVPLNIAAMKLVKIGKVPVSIGGGVGYWLGSPTNGPEGFRFRLQANIVLQRN